MHVGEQTITTQRRYLMRSRGGFSMGNLRLIGDSASCGPVRPSIAGRPTHFLMTIDWEPKNARRDIIRRPHFAPHFLPQSVSWNRAQHKRLFSLLFSPRGILAGVYFADEKDPAPGTPITGSLLRNKRVRARLYSASAAPSREGVVSVALARLRDEGLPQTRQSSQLLAWTGSARACL